MGLRHAVAIALIVASAETFAGPPERPEHALALARTYLARWLATLTNLVVEEDYHQELRRYRRSMSSRIPPTEQRRRIRSELLLLRAPAEDVWLTFRDVIAVDETLLRDRQKRFDALFSGPAAAIRTTAERIAKEGHGSTWATIERSTRRRRRSAFCCRVTTRTRDGSSTRTSG
jgi:hypothetical protein